MIRVLPPDIPLITVTDLEQRVSVVLSTANTAYMNLTGIGGDTAGVVFPLNQQSNVRKIWDLSGTETVMWKVVKGPTGTLDITTAYGTANVNNLQARVLLETPAIDSSDPNDHWFLAVKRNISATVVFGGSAWT